MLNEIQQLQRLLNEAVYPNIEDRLRFGCEMIYKANGNVCVINSKVYDYELKNIFDNNIILGLPINLDLIMAALEKKGMNPKYENNRIFVIGRHRVFYTPLSPIPSETVKALLEIFKNSDYGRNNNLPIST